MRQVDCEILMRYRNFLAVFDLLTYSKQITKMFAKNQRNWKGRLDHFFDILNGRNYDYRGALKELRMHIPESRSHAGLSPWTILQYIWQITGLSKRNGEAKDMPLIVCSNSDNCESNLKFLTNLEIVCHSNGSFSLLQSCEICQQPMTIYSLPESFLARMHLKATYKQISLPKTESHLPEAIIQFDQKSAFRTICIKDSERVYLFDEVEVSLINKKEKFDALFTDSNWVSEVVLFKRTRPNTTKHFREPMKEEKRSLSFKATRSPLKKKEVIIKMEEDM